MNEQIKQLAFQAMSINQKVSDDAFFVDVSKLKEFEKFAELLLKASFDVVINDGRFHDAKGIIRAGKYTAMEHFGIEE